MSPEKRALKRVAIVVGVTLGTGILVGLLIPLLASILTPMIVVGILMTSSLVYLTTVLYDMFVSQEKAKDSLK
jgi:hypothetical protein